MSDYIDAGLHRRRRAPLGIAGSSCEDEEGRVARFTFALAPGAGADVIADVTFDCTACVTLVAYCELLCTRVQGSTPAEALRALQPQTLAEALPLVPPARRPCAQLAARALAAALVTGLQEVHP